MHSPQFVLRRDGRLDVPVHPGATEVDGLLGATRRRPGREREREQAETQAWLWPRYPEPATHGRHREQIDEQHWKDRVLDPAAEEAPSDDHNEHHPCGD